jgi:hypothetical protein
MSAPLKRQVSGGAIRGVIKASETLHMLESLKPKLSAAAARHLERQPSLLAWFDGAELDSFLTAAYDTRGEGMVLQLSAQIYKQSFGPAIVPVVRTIVAMFGTSPVALLSRLDSLSTLFLRGVKSSYKALGDTEVELRIRSVDQPSKAWFIAQKALFPQAFEVCGLSGRVRTMELDPDGMGAVYRLSWSPPAVRAS